MPSLRDLPALADVVDHLEYISGVWPEDVPEDYPCTPDEVLRKKAATKARAALAALERVVWEERSAVVDTRHTAFGLRFTFKMFNHDEEGRSASRHAEWWNDEIPGDARPYSWEPVAVLPLKTEDESDDTPE